MSQPGLATATIADRSASVEISPNQLGLMWRIYQITVSVGSSTDPVTSFSVLATLNDIPIMSRSTGATPICADGPPAIDVGPHQTLRILISDVSILISQTVTVSYEYEELPSS